MNYLEFLRRTFLELLHEAYNRKNYKVIKYYYM